VGTIPTLPPAEVTHFIFMAAVALVTLPPVVLVIQAATAGRTMRKVLGDSSLSFWLPVLGALMLFLTIPWEIKGQQGYSLLTYGLSIMVKSFAVA